MISKSSLVVVESPIPPMKCSKGVDEKMQIVHRGAMRVSHRLHKCQENV